VPSSLEGPFLTSLLLQSRDLIHSSWSIGEVVCGCCFHRIFIVVFSVYVDELGKYVGSHLESVI
jgi:hypothetical protein